MRVRITSSLALVLAASVALLGCGGTDDDDAGTGTSGRSATTGTTVTTGEAVTTGTPGTSSTAKAPTASAGSDRPDRAFKVRVKDGRPVGGPVTWTASKGDTVLLQVTADQADEVHVHGYDEKADVSPGAPVKLQFTADATGIFEVELEGSQTKLGDLRVKP